MDDDTLTHGMRGLVANCAREAAKRGTNVVEAEHVLLALAADTATPTAALLADAGLPHGAIETALRAERLQSLAAAGVTPVDASLLTAAPRTVKPLGCIGRRGQDTRTSRAAGRAPTAFSRGPSAHRHPASGGRHRAARPVDRGHRSKRPHRRLGGAVTPHRAPCVIGAGMPLPVGGRQGLPRRPLSNAS